MKKYLVLFTFLMIATVFTFCTGTRKSSSHVIEIPKINYEANIQPLIVSNCTPCHFPEKGGSKKPFNSYASVMENIDEIVNRIELSPADRGFMPFKHAKLSDSTINIFRQWKTDGLLAN